MAPSLSAIYFVIRAMLFGMVATLILGFISMKLAWRIQLIDEPNAAPHKQHTRPTPLSGGIALFTALLAGALWLGTFGSPAVRASTLAGAVIFVFGLLDDYFRLRPLVKLVGQVLAVVILIRMGVYVRIFESPEFFFNGQGPLYLYLDWLVTLLWIIGITNAFNFVDSMDGLAVGLGVMAAGFFVLLTLEADQFSLLLHSAVIVGVCLALYFYNSPPALLFLGDSGAQTLGFTLAVLAIAYRPQGAFQSSSWFVPIALLGVPIFDTVLIVISRLRRGQPVYTAARDHTYHRLMHLLHSPNRAVLVMQIGALLVSCLAILGLNQPPAIANAIFGFMLVAGAAALLFLETCEYGAGTS
jgi:UDP-GlcNAc:undecaprenyl-phosphate GlcNAc-1-phosphate transferase